jgi:hypothetical protein
LVAAASGELRGERCSKERAVVRSLAAARFFLCGPFAQAGDERKSCGPGTFPRWSQSARARVDLTRRPRAGRALPHRRRRSAMARSPTATAGMTSVRPCSAIAATSLPAAPANAEAERVWMGGLPGQIAYVKLPKYLPHGAVWHSGVWLGGLPGQIAYVKLPKYRPRDAVRHPAVRLRGPADRPFVSPAGSPSA